MIIRKTASYFSYSLAGMVLSVVTVPFLTRMLSPEEYAFLGLFSTLIFVFLPWLSFSSAELVNINRVVLDQRSYIDFRNRFISFSFMLLVLSVLTVLVVTEVFFGQYRLLALLTLGVAFGRVLIGIHSAELVQAGKASRYGVLNLVTSLLVLLATIAFLLFWNASWEQRLYAILFAEWSVTLCRIVFYSDIAETFHFHIDAVEAKKIVHFGAPLFLALGLAWTIYESDKIIVLNFFSLKELGYYTAAYSIGTLVDRLNQSVTNAIIPKLYSALNEGNGRQLLQSYNLYYSIFILLFAGIVSIFFYFFSGLILGKQYEDTGLITTVVLFAFAFSGIYRTSGVVINFFKLNVLKTRILFYGAAVNVILSIGLIPYTGLLAPAIGTLAAFMVTALLLRHLQN